jgi:hypothetical protein
MKNMKTVGLLFFLSHFVLQITRAQPGDGGGIQVLRIVDKDNHLVYPADIALRIKYFILSDNEPYTVVSSYTDAERDWQYNFTRIGKPHIYIPPYLVKKTGNVYVPNQRLLLMYKYEIMAIDFIDVLPINPGGASDVIRLLKFYPAHFICYRNKAKHLPNIFTKEIAPAHELSVLQDAITRAMEKGINDETLPLLSTYQIIEQWKRPLKQLVFLKEGNYDTAYLPSSPSNDLPLENIIFRDSSILIHTNSYPLVIDSGLQYKFYFTAGGSIDHSGIFQAGSKQMALCIQLNTATLYINNKKFTGVLKILFPFRNIIGSVYTGYSMGLYVFKEGKKTSITQGRDIDSDAEEPVRVRPN